METRESVGAVREREREEASRNRGSFIQQSDTQVTSKNDVIFSYPKIEDKSRESI